MNRFRELRQKKGLSQMELAKAINVDQTAVSRWELGKAFPDISIAAKVADFFGVSIDYFHGREQIKKGPVETNPDGLSEEDIKLVKRLMALSPEQAAAVRELVRVLEGNH